MVSIFSCCIVNVENRYNNKAADTRTASAASASEQSRHKAPKQRQSLCIILLVHQIMGLHWWQGTVLAWMHRRGHAKVTHPLPAYSVRRRPRLWVVIMLTTVLSR